MTYKEREEIFSKEFLHISDVQKLFGVAQSTASILMTSWKRKILYSGKDLRINLEGKIHIMDYFDVMNINTEDPGERYARKKEEATQEDDFIIEKPAPRRKSLCV